MSLSQKTVTLPGGYKSPDPKAGGAVGRAVVFGRRLTLGDLVKIEADAQSNIEVQSTLLHLRASITSFEGVRRNPVPLSVLLQLDGADRETLAEGFVEFLRDSLGERASETLSETEFKLAFGLQIGGEVYDVLEFAPEAVPLTGYDEVKLEKQFGAGLRKDVALIAREVVRLSQSDGEATSDAGPTVEDLERMDALDFGGLKEFAAARQASFRRARKALSGNGQ